MNLHPNLLSITDVKMLDQHACLLFYECETWSVTLTGEHRQTVFEYRVLTKIFGPKREEGDWRRLHNEELQDLYSSSITIW